MKSLSLLVLFALFSCSACIELGVQNSAGSSASSSSGNGSGGQGGQGGGAGGVAGNDVTSGSGASGGGVTAFCDSQDATLIACYEFEGNAADGSQYDNATQSTNVTYQAGYQGQAASFHSNSQVALANSSTWQISQYTAELWYYQRSYGATRMGLMDSHDRLGIFVYGQGDLRCLRTPDVFLSRVNMPLNQWNHVACVFDGITLSMYINGALESSIPAPAISGGATNAIGSNAPSGDGFDGLIDSVRVWNVPHSAKEICASAGIQGC